MSESERKSLTEKDRYEIPIWFKIMFLLLLNIDIFQFYYSGLTFVKLRRQYTVYGFKP